VCAFSVHAELSVCDALTTQRPMTMIPPDSTSVIALFITSFLAVEASQIVAIRRTTRGVTVNASRGAPAHRRDRRSLERQIRVRGGGGAYGRDEVTSEGQYG